MNHELKLLRRMWPHARPDMWAFGYALLITPLIAGVGLAQPWLIKQVIDVHIVPGKLDGLAGLAFLYLGAVLVSYILEATYTLVIAWAGQRTILRLRMALYDHALTLKQTFFDIQPAGKLLTRLTSDLESLGEALSAGVVTILLDALVIVGVAAAMLWLDWRMTVVIFLLAPPLLLTLDLLRRRLKSLYLSIREQIAAINAFLAERVDGVQIVQLFRNEEASIRRFDTLNDRFRRQTSTSNIYDAMMYSVVDGASSIFVAVMLWYGAGLGGELLGFAVPDTGVVSAGLLVAFIDYLDRLFRPLRSASGKIAVIQRATAALEKIYDLFEGSKPADPGVEPVSEVRGHLVLRDVHFRYRPETDDVLRGVDFEVRPGEVVAVVGPTGSGKTTLTRILDRSYQGYRGEITVDGRELSSLRSDELRRHLAAVRQDIQLFSETVRFNVDLDNARIGPAQAEEAARVVHADGVLERIGWDHIMRERGANLSVGEGQLLTFARTMAHDPAVVILDEATASIDSLTERLIQDAIKDIFARKTVIVVAHRLSTIRSADRIAVMDMGRIVELGSHADLMAQNGRYAALVHAGRAVVGEVVSAGK